MRIVAVIRAALQSHLRREPTGAKVDPPQEKAKRVLSERTGTENGQNAAV
jgi:hypothetical protein